MKKHFRLNYNQKIKSFHKIDEKEIEYTTNINNVDCENCKTSYNEMLVNLLTRNKFSQLKLTKLWRYEKWKIK